MTVATASCSSLKMYFKEFSSVSDAEVQFALDQATRYVDNSWLAKDQLRGQLYCAAHYLEVKRAREESRTGQMVKTERIGDISTTYMDTPQPKEGSEDDFTTTPYGTRFLEIVGLNKPGILVV